jgi:NAD(P)-dependent dehydrogenase (short-subunit alcohol dehydrogenase family)
VGILDGKVLIVTGAGRGIGREHALELARQGATVVVNDLGSGVGGEATGEDPAAEVLTEIEALGAKGMTDRSSVADFTAMGRLVAKTVEQFGRLDGIVNNAGVVRDRMLTSLSETDWDTVLAVHLKGTFNLTKHACDHWRAVAKRGEPVTGRVINTTSGAGMWGNIGQSAYGAAKAGIIGFTQVVALEMGRYNVTANCISPLAVTRMSATIPVLADRTVDDGWDPRHPGLSSPVVAWLASDDSGWLTGQVLRVDGDTLSHVKGFEVAPKTHRASSGGRLDPLEIGPALRKMYGVVPPGLSISA